MSKLVFGKKLIEKESSVVQAEGRNAPLKEASFKKSKVYLMILDGFGEGPADAQGYHGNAIAKAHMQNLEELKKQYPWTLIKASGHAVGLPEGQDGNSEVGHFTMGSGRITFQSLERINVDIKNRSFFKMPAFLDAINKVNKTEKAALHLLGMISDAGVHSHLNHLYALLELAKASKVKKVYIHAITDGRDVPERTAKDFIKQIQDKISELDLQNVAKIATIVGRFYAMDRDNNWDRTEKAFNLLTLGEGVKETDPIKAIDNAYARNIETDYYIDPIILDEHGEIKDKDSVIFFNFRTDRTRQLTQAFTGECKIGFVPKKEVRPFFVCFGDYSSKAPVVFPTQKIVNNLGEVISCNNLKQLRIAETEKYAHVTYFFNSQIEAPFKNEERVLVESPKVPSYAQKPEMSAREVTQTVIKKITQQDYSLVVQNFANPDLVGHSGNFEATVKACQVIDECIKKIADAAVEKGYTFILTADHGNAEYMTYKENGDQCPSHTANPVICLIVSPELKSAKLRTDAGLQDIAPTILNLLQIPVPKEMTGKSIIKN